MRKLCIWLAFVLAAAVGSFAACRDELPVPNSPLRRELPPQGPKPGPLVPTPTPVRIDGSVLPIETRAVFQASATDAAVDALTLPKNPDARLPDAPGAPR